MGRQPRIRYALVNREGIVDCEIVKGDKALGEKYGGMTQSAVMAERKAKGYVVVGNGLIAVPVPVGGLTDEKAKEIFRAQKPSTIRYVLVNSEGIVDGEIVKGDNSLGKKYDINWQKVADHRRRLGYVVVGDGLIAVPLSPNGLTNEEALGVFRGHRKIRNQRTTDQCISILRTWWEAMDGSRTRKFLMT